ncbi:DUF2269 family protein [Algimonas porphyrae]|uniref:Membrane protein n=1 Tax=Algimonas porphyrae TaxID=1128113 RepID=A0ABQ5UZL0_9PROT|nr:DUF2269 domain-containing protein [Algimonas porphyrae]GLQ20733.1 membrane protein [Algimonas porphyrae]
MMIDFVRWLHVIGATVLLGTGAGIAFFMLMAHRTRSPTLIAHTAHIVVIADWVFTASAVVIQPLTGLWLAHMIGWPLTEGWILLSVGLYVLTGIFWLPVVRIQKKMRDLALQAVRERTDLPARYDHLFRIWFACGVPAFFSVLAILWLMIARPVF